MERSKIVSNLERGVFAGPQATSDYMDPHQHPPTILKEITSGDLNPYRREGVRYFAKMMDVAGFGQVKGGPVFNMYSAAEKRGELEGVDQIHEATSGNTGAALSLIAEKPVVLYVNSETPEDKIRMLQLCGAQVIVTSNGIAKAKAAAEVPGNFSFWQYGNTDNPGFFDEVIGPQIWKQTQGEVTLFVAGLGTTGTMVGISDHLKAQNPDIRTVGVIVADGNSVPGVRTRKRLEEVSFPWQEKVNNTQIVNAHDSYASSLGLIRAERILAGPSSGFALQGLNQEIGDRMQDGTLDPLRNSNGEVIAVFPIPDAPWLYIPEYFRHLDSSHFKDVIYKE